MNHYSLQSIITVTIKVNYQSNNITSWYYPTTINSINYQSNNIPSGYYFAQSNLFHNQLNQPPIELFHNTNMHLLIPLHLHKTIIDFILQLVLKYANVHHLQLPIKHTTHSSTPLAVKQSGANPGLRFRGVIIQTTEKLSNKKIISINQKNNIHLTLYNLVLYNYKYWSPVYFYLPY